MKLSVFTVLLLTCHSLLGKDIDLKGKLPEDFNWTAYFEQGDQSTVGQMDQATAAAIERGEGDEVRAEDACGWLPIRGWLALARQRSLRVERLDLRNSGDMPTGDRRSVVGYGAWAIVHN